jgi:hypothetical protein
MRTFHNNIVWYFHYPFHKHIELLQSNSAAPTVARPAPATDDEGEGQGKWNLTKKGSPWRCGPAGGRQRRYRGLEVKGGAKEDVEVQGTSAPCVEEVLTRGWQ